MSDVTVSNQVKESHKESKQEETDKREGSEYKDKEKDEKDTITSSATCEPTVQNDFNIQPLPTISEEDKDNSQEIEDGNTSNNISSIEASSTEKEDKCFQNYKSTTETNEIVEDKNGSNLQFGSSSPISFNISSTFDKDYSFGTSSKNIEDNNDSVTNLFVNYLPARAGDDALCALFSTYGEVESCKVMIDLHTGLSRCFGFVKYKYPESAKQAISILNGYKIDNKSLVVKPANSPSTSDNTPKGTPSSNIYLKGIADGITRDYIWELFSPFGAISDIKIITDSSGKNKGIAFIQYSSKEEAEKAIMAMNGSPIKGSSKPLLVRFADTPSERQTRQRQRISAPRYTPYTPVGVPGYIPQPYIHPTYPMQTTMMPTSGGIHPTFPPTASPQLERNLFIYHLPPNATDTLLYKLFSPFGAIESTKAVKDSGGQCKGFGFVKMVHHTDAVRAIQIMNGSQVGNKYIKVSFKR